MNIENEAFTLDIIGLCYSDDDSLTICDENSGSHYTFGYQLYGDRVELCYNGGVLVLNKADNQ